MKNITLLTLTAMMLFAGNAVALDLNGTWIADNQCVPGDGDAPYLVPKSEDSTITVTQEGIFFTTDNDEGEICGGVINGKSISMTCPGTLFYGEFKPPKTIIGVNHILDDGATCSVVAIKK